MLDMAYNLKINILIYEYMGYGEYKGQVNDKQIIVDIQKVYSFATTGLQFRFENIILYGQSIGSGPSIFLAANRLQPIGGLILHSPIASGFKSLNFNTKQCCQNDLFPNSDLIKYVNCPVFIMHGTNDKIVNINHAQLLFKNIPTNDKSIWQVPGADHNDIQEMF